MSKEALGRLILEASTGTHGDVAKQLADAWAEAASAAQALAAARDGTVYFLGASPVNGQFTGVLQRRDPDGTVTVVDTVQTSEAALREGGCFAQMRETK